MSFLTIVVKKFIGLIHSILACVRRVLCFMRRRTKEPDVLPFTANYPREESSWQSWDKFTDPVNNKIEAYRERVAREIEEKERKISGNEEKAPDFFTEMAPQVKKTKKILLKQGRSKNDTSSSNRFSVAAAVPHIPETSELGVLADEGQTDLWEVEDNSLDVDQVIKEARQKERIERQQKRKERTNVQQTNVTKRMEAVRISFSDS